MFRSLQLQVYNKFFEHVVSANFNNLDFLACMYSFKIFITNSKTVINVCNVYSYVLMIYFFIKYLYSMCIDF